MNLEEIDLDLMGTTSGETIEALKTIWPERIIDEKTKKEQDNKNISDDEDFDWD